MSLVRFPVVDARTNALHQTEGYEQMICYLQCPQSESLTMSSPSDELLFLRQSHFLEH